MFRKAIFTAATALTLLLSPAGAQDRFTVDKVVAVVGNSIILYSDIEETVDQIQTERRQYGITSDRNPRIEALEHLLEQKLLYNQALIDSVEINKMYAVQDAEDRVGDMVEQIGSVAALEEHFHSPIYEIKRIITNRIEEQSYASEMRNEIRRKVKITPGEVERFYKKLHRDSIPIIPIKYSYAQITRFPASTKDAKLRAREQMLSLRERIIEGTRFEVLARMYSEDPATAHLGGEMDFAPAESFELPFGNALERLRPGQVSEIVETIYGYHIIQLIDKSGNLYKSRHILVRPQFTTEEIVENNKFLDSLAIQIRADSITFERAAFVYSDDKSSKYNGGLVSNLDLLMRRYGMVDAGMATTKHRKDDLPVEDFQALDKLQIGEISDAFAAEDVNGNRISKILKLVEITPSHTANLSEDYLELEEMALRDKMQKEYDIWLNKKIGSMFIRIDPEFRIYEEFENKTWLK